MCIAICSGGTHSRTRRTCANVAVRSITIDDVVYVIDSGKHKEKTYNAADKVWLVRCGECRRACLCSTM